MENMENKYTLNLDAFMTVMCILFPMVGWMLYAFHAASHPWTAKKCMKLSLILPIVSMILSVIVVIISML